MTNALAYFTRERTDVSKSCVAQAAGILEDYFKFLKKKKNQVNLNFSSIRVTRVPILRALYALVGLVWVIDRIHNTSCSNLQMGPIS